MRKLILAAALVIAAPAFAGTLSTETHLGTSMDAVKAALIEMGYEVRKMELEDGMIEAYIVGQDEMGEIYIDRNTGMIRRLKMK